MKLRFVLGCGAALSLMVSQSSQALAGGVQPSSGDQGQLEEKAKVVTPWNPGWILQTSPLGDLGKRYNLQLGHFFSQNFLLSIKGSKFDHSANSVLDHDLGYELGIRASYYQFPRNGIIGLGGHFGAFYTDFKRGNSLDDALNYLFLNPTIDRDEVKGPMFELAMGSLIHWNSWMTTEFLGGLQAYEVSYYSYNTKTGERSTRKPSQWHVYPVLELNLGVAF